MNPGGTVDDPGGGKIRSGHVLHQTGNIQIGIVDQGQTGIADLGQIVWRDIGRHTHRDPGRAIDQQIGQAGRQYLRLGFGFIVVGDKVDGFLVDIGQQIMGNAGHTHFGVSHRCR